MPGSIEQRGPNTFRLVVSGGRDASGNRKKYTKTVKIEGKTEDELKKKAEKELARFVTDVDSETFIEPSKMSFEAFSKQWMQSYAKPNLAPKTLHEYERLLNKRILPAMGHMKLSTLKPIHFVKFFSNLQENGMRKDKKEGVLSNNTILHYYRLLNKMMNTAVKWELISTNPVSNVDKPKLPQNEGDFYGEDEVPLLLENLALEPIERQVAILLPLAGSLRAGEVTGLKWENVIFEEKQLSIVEVTQYISKKGIVTKAPKNISSKRIISIPPSLVNLLKELKAKQDEDRKKCGDKWVETGYVLTKWNGEAIHPDTPGKWFSKIIAKYKLRKITFHQLRHTSATLLIAAGENVRALSSRLGHAETSTTMNIYAHVLRSADKSAAKKLEKIFKTKKKNKE